MPAVEEERLPAGGSGQHDEEGEGASRWQLRLMISIPALLVLVTLGHGLIAYQILSARWSELEQAGAGDVARALLRNQLIAALVMTLLALAAGLGLAVTILKPIRAISETAQIIASGKLDQRPPRLATPREFGDLFRSFNSMVDFVNTSFQERNRYLIEGIVTGLLTVNMDGTLTALNSPGAKILGVASSDVVGRNVEDLPAMLPAKYRPFAHYLREALRRDPTRMPDEIVVDSDQGSSSLQVAMSVLRDARGTPNGIMLNFQDAARIRNLREQLSKTDHLAALGTFTMGLAHEIRNPLSSIKGTIQLMDLDEGTTAQSREMLNRVVREVDRLDLFIRELLDFSNASPSPPEDTDLNTVLHRAALMGQDESNPKHEGISLVKNLRPVPRILGEPDRLTQAFANIIRNAFEAAQPESRITVEARRTNVRNSVYVDVTIHNTGSTIAPEDRSKIFDPFFSTKERGSGLGLAIAYQIISQNRGTLDVTAGPNEVTFTARFRAGSDVESLNMEPLKAGSLKD